MMLAFEIRIAFIYLGLVIGDGHATLWKSRRSDGEPPVHLES